ncbi:hypothetical protein [Rhodopseudomonas palustris]|uniref:hypothetical protein n=1 Tax=Rhodopseudomonas palustris TaxID=1076 RepID=UPI000E5BD87E|nr:hypothetical protein [Rhodopseudomonas palustris]QLH73466.1 hypothetical protein HZF03_22740 [Rhodopseudomonas palustris]RIA02871.1 hypothetical protein D1920_05260 [Rhodopseudomonas palustris]
MYAGFKPVELKLGDIDLDDKNPRIVSQTPLTTQGAILAYLYEHEELEAFIKRIASEGHNVGAERPYVIKKGTRYVVIEGNTRVAAYKVLTGLIKPPKDYAQTVPNVSETLKKALLNVVCTLAPDRDSLMPVMAGAHFGRGDKSQWGYLGSRQTIYNEWKAGKTLGKIGKVFRLTQGEVKDYILEYQLYLKALSLNWTHKEKDVLLAPNVAFNPPVRFLQTSGHKDKMGIKYDTANLKVVFAGDADKKFKHLVKKLVVNPERGLGATASYDSVFSDYDEASSGAKPAKTGRSAKTGGASGASGGSSGGGSTGGGSAGGATGSGSPKPKPGALFGYQPGKINSGLITQLLKEAKEINCRKYPAAATFLLRNIVESILKHIIDVQGGNKTGKSHDLEGALNYIASNAIVLPPGDKKILAEFKRDHLAYLNLGAHGNIIPNETRLAAARDSIDQFVKKHV